MILSIFGHELDDDIMQDCEEVVTKESWFRRFLKNFYLSPYLINPRYFLEMFDRDIHKYRFVFDDKFETSAQMFDAITSKFWEAIKVIHHVSIDFLRGKTNKLTWHPGRVWLFTSKQVNLLPCVTTF